MKKFTNINENNNSVDKSTNTSDFIMNLINESLTIQDNNIEGKNELHKVIMGIIQMNDTKNTIKVLETVKYKSFHRLDLNWINDEIDSLKESLNTPIMMGEVSENITENSEEIEMINEAKCDTNCDDTKDKECDGEEVEEEVEEEVKENNHGFVDAIEEEQDDDSAITNESVNFLEDVDNLYSIMEQIKIGAINEHHLESKKDRIEFILSKLDGDKTKKVIIELVSKLPDYTKTGDIEETLNGASDKEVETIYLGVEEAQGVQESVVENEIMEKVEFIDMYKPKTNHITESAKFSGNMFETFGDEMDFVKTQISENKVWTIVENEENKFTAISGVHSMNRVGYIVTEHPYGDNTIEVSL